MIGIRISKEGSTVKDGSDKQYVDTTTPLFKLFDTNKGARTYNASNLFATPDNFTIPHNLGYPPMNFIFMDRADNANRKLVISEDSSSPDNTVLINASADIKNINISVQGVNPGTVTGTFGYNYFIFYDKAG